MLPILAPVILAAHQQFPEVVWTKQQIQSLFQGNARVSFEGDSFVVESNGIPNHQTGSFPNSSNSNAIRPQRLRFYFSMHPRKADRPCYTPFGPIGLAVNGIPFYNQYNGQGQDAVRLEVFDSCCGHPDQRGMYHYHQYPTCIKSPFHDPDGKHSPIIGFMFDGFAIYGPNGEDGRPPTDLDACNGHEDKVRGYHYHVTKNYPYLIGGYRGVLDMRDFRGPGG